MDERTDNMLHGNNAKVEKNKKIIGLNLTSTVTMSDHKDHEVPIVDDTNVAYAKKFVEINKK